MSKTIPAIERVGIPTSQILAEPKESGNPSALSVAAFSDDLTETINDKAITPLDEGSRTLAQITTLCEIIRQEANNPSRIKDLASVARRIADDSSNYLDGERNHLQEKILPRLLAALSNGGEA